MIHFIVPVGRRHYRYHLMDEIASRTGYIWNDRFDSAYLYIEGVKEKIRENDLEGDTLLTRAIEAYIYRIHVRQCSNSREEAEILSFGQAAKKNWTGSDSIPLICTGIGEEQPGAYETDGT